MGFGCIVELEYILSYKTLLEFTPPPKTVLFCSVVQLLHNTETRLITKAIGSIVLPLSELK